MSLDYRLTLSGGTSAEQLAERALPGVRLEPSQTGSARAINLVETNGFGLSVRTGRNGFIDVVSDSGSFEWEPDPYAAVRFTVDKSADPVWVATNMITIVRRVLESGSEEAALVANSDVLLLTRLDGKLVKHHQATWWAHYPAADGLIPG
ncbi:SitI3 family protein [Actinoplanes philippinensis]|uniref:SitI3 family protein n=1 Tax=Actinoplanes philippinensis TaxID=35752 RepID=UPI0033C73103